MGVVASQITVAFSKKSIIGLIQHLLIDFIWFWIFLLGHQQQALHHWSYVRATDGLPLQGVVNVERVFIVWRHHKLYVRCCPSGMCFMFCKMSSINWVELNQKSYQNIQASTELPALPIGHFPILFLFQRRIRILSKISLKFVPIRPIDIKGNSSAANKWQAITHNQLWPRSLTPLCVTIST